MFYYLFFCLDAKECAGGRTVSQKTRLASRTGHNLQKKSRNSAVYFTEILKLTSTQQLLFCLSSLNHKVLAQTVRISNAQPTGISGDFF